jgi:uncharacterized protein (DUF2236 family)
MMWTINRESVLLLGGRGSLLLQLAHPSVAAGVAEHSDFRANPLGRLRRTLDTMHAIIFGDEVTAPAALENVNRMHAHVRGTTEDGHSYDARDPRLLAWVYSTLVESSVTVYSACVRPLSESEIAAYYAETLMLAPLMGIPEGALPSSYQGLRAWMAGMIHSGEVHVTPLARELAEPILRPVPLLPRRVAEDFFTASLLPEVIRAGYGLRLSRTGNVLVMLGQRASKRVIPLVPGRLRVFPIARRAAARA